MCSLVGVLGGSSGAGSGVIMCGYHPKLAEAEKKKEVSLHLLVVQSE